MSPVILGPRARLTAFATRIDMYGAPVLQGRRSTFLGSLGTEARLLGISIRLASEVVEYWDSRDEPAVVLRGGEVLRADVCDSLRRQSCKSG